MPWPCHAIILFNSCTIIYVKCVLFVACAEWLSTQCDLPNMIMILGSLDVGRGHSWHRCCAVCCVLVLILDKRIGWNRSVYIYDADKYRYRTSNQNANTINRYPKNVKIRGRLFKLGVKCVFVLGRMRCVRFWMCACVCDVSYDWMENS